MIAKRLFYLSPAILLIFGVVASAICVASSNEDPIVHVDPPYNSVPTDHFFTVNISVVKVTNLSSWQFKLYVKKNVLETNVTLIEEGPFLSQNGAYLTELTRGYDGMFWTVGCHIIGTESVDGSGTIASITFKVLQEGESSIALIETKLWNPAINPIPHTSQGGYFGSEMVRVINEVEVDSQNFTIVMTTNSSVSPVPFDLNIGQKEISFNVLGPDSMIGYCNISIPKRFMNSTELGDWEVTVGYSPPTSLVPTENSTHTFLYFTYATSIHKVRITSTNIVPEFPATIFALLFIIANLAAASLGRKLGRSNSTPHKRMHAIQ